MRSFRLMVAPPQGGSPLPLRTLQFLHKGQRIRYEPLPLSNETLANKSAEVALIFISPGDTEYPLRVLGPKPANVPAEWVVPDHASTVALVYGPHGLDTKKVTSLINKNHDLIPQLADYAGQTEQVEALVEGTGNLNAALSGFAARYNANTPKFDSKTPSEQQAAALFGALLPSLSAYDPVASQATVTMRQSAGLAAAVASLFFGSPVGLAAGGAAMFQNLSALAFPQTEFRSTFAQTLPAGAIGLCAKPRPAKSRTRTAFLWAHRVPGDVAPTVSLEPSQHIPVAWKSTVRIAAADAAQSRLLERVTGWALSPIADASQSFPITASLGLAPNTLELDLSHSAAPGGKYRLSALWDWEPFTLAGALHVDRFADLSNSTLVPSSSDRLIESTGKVTLRLTGSFHFVDRVSIGETVLPFAQRAGELAIEIDTNAIRRGAYHLALRQKNGAATQIPVEVLPPLPAIANLPLRVNLGEVQQRISLTATGLDRVEGVSTEGAECHLEGSTLQVRLGPNVEKGSRLALTMRVRGRHKPLVIAEAIEVLGPLPRITGIRQSFAGDLAVALRPGDIPVAGSMSLAVQVENIESPPALEVTCGKQTSTPKPGNTGDGSLFVTLDTAAAGDPGCVLSIAVVTTAGRSPGRELGRLVQLPRIDSVELTADKLGDAIYVAIIRGESLETIAATGWDSERSLPVPGIPAPVAGQAHKQSLRIAVPWPSPEPRAPIFVWLRGETAARPTTARY